MLFDEGPDVWRNGCPVEAHHEQLALYTMRLAKPLQQPAESSYHGPAS